jgi:hypothetical protein
VVGLISYHADRLKEWCRGLRDSDNQESFEMFCIGSEERLRYMARVVAEMRSRLKKRFADFTEPARRREALVTIISADICGATLTSLVTVRGTLARCQ